MIRFQSNYRAGEYLTGDLVYEDERKTCRSCDSGFRWCCRWIYWYWLYVGSENPTWWKVTSANSWVLQKWKHDEELWLFWFNWNIRLNELYPSHNAIIICSLWQWQNNFSSSYFHSKKCQYINYKWNLRHKMLEIHPVVFIYLNDACHN